MDEGRGQSPGSFGKYQFEERLGCGGMAEVWRAKNVGAAGFERACVVKRILPHLSESPEFVAMFIAEARLSAQLSHPNIVQVHEFGELDGQYCLVMERVDGRDLRHVLARQAELGGKLQVGFAVLVVRDVCRALGYAHALKDPVTRQPLCVLHRDVSPSNIMVTRQGAVKLLDFGIAKAMASAPVTRVGVIKGKLGYISPEQAEGKVAGPRSDQFAVGVVLHELLTGRRLFRTHDDAETLALVRQAVVTAPSLLNGEVPPELDRICLKMLARDPRDRFASCDELAGALEEVAHTMRYGQSLITDTVARLFPEQAAAGEQSDLFPMRRTAQLGAPAAASAATSTYVASTGLGRRPRRAWPWIVGLGAPAAAAVALVLGFGGRDVATTPATPSAATAPSTTPPAAPSAAATTPPAAPSVVPAPAAMAPTPPSAAAASANAPAAALAQPLARPAVAAPPTGAAEPERAAVERHPAHGKKTKHVAQSPRGAKLRPPDDEWDPESASAR